MYSSSGGREGDVGHGSLQRVMSPSPYQGAVLSAALGPPAALLRARCRACGDHVIGPSVTCTICGME
eukprot:4743734-Pyramimonas_sp.AAC.1